MMTESLSRKRLRFLRGLLIAEPEKACCEGFRALLGQAGDDEALCGDRPESVAVLEDADFRHGSLPEFNFPVNPRAPQRVPGARGGA
ncbi:hypothetical protein Mext_0945 [Methylorubrum extorquens PA1]|nr:hypothetical protein Mext_0945 [Methylorubrum extorquens PA1]